MTCNYCRKKVHPKKDCWKLKVKQFDECKFKEGSSTEACYVEEVEDICSLVVTSEYEDDNSWIWDTGCSSHMTFNSSFLSTYQKVDRRKVIMAYGAYCPIIGIGDVEFTVFDGVVRTLSEILHIPSLNKHLISLGTLVEEGFRCIGKGGV